MHQVIEDGENLEHFYELYEQLPPSHMDLATRWNDLGQTLLYRCVSLWCHDISFCLSLCLSVCLSFSLSLFLSNKDTSARPQVDKQAYILSVKNTPLYIFLGSNTVLFKPVFSTVTCTLYVNMNLVTLPSFLYQGVLQAAGGSGAVPTDHVQQSTPT